MDETDALVNDLQEWKRTDLLLEKPSPMMIEIYLDTSHMPHNQSLLCVDESGRPREVVPASSTEGSPAPFKNGKRYREVVLERWTIELGDVKGLSQKQLSEPLPSVYKKGIVAFRTLYSRLRLLPAWKLYRQLARLPSNQQPLRLKYRIRQPHELNYPQHDDPLTAPLFSLPASEHGRRDLGASRSARESSQPRIQHFADLLSPAGPLQARVAYRHLCDFSVASSEAVLSAALLSSEHSVFAGGRSLPEDRSEQRRDQ
jgi:autophagy-related protein 13